MLAAQTDAALLSLSCSSPLILAAFSGTSPFFDPVSTQRISYGASIILPGLYIFYTIFQFKTRPLTYQVEVGGRVLLFRLWQSSILLLLFTVALAFCGDYLVDSMDGLSTDWGLSFSFIGMIVLPFVANITDLFELLAAARRDEMDYVLLNIFGPSLQTTLLMAPLLVFIGWIIGSPMDLDFGFFSTCLLLFPIIIVHYVIKDGESNWLKGVTLIAAYTIIAIAMYT